MELIEYYKKIIFYNSRVLTKEIKSHSCYVNLCLICLRQYHLHCEISKLEVNTFFQLATLFIVTLNLTVDSAVCFAISSSDYLTELCNLF